ncbi:MAG: hypothetical protein KDJ75_05550 [Alphaproteobacteria bacterium]|nr:hypothetical protein [Alphaproteobacteria bacterium]
MKAIQHEFDCQRDGLCEEIQRFVVEAAEEFRVSKAHVLLDLREWARCAQVDVRPAYFMLADRDVVNTSDEDIVAEGRALTPEESERWVDLIDTMLPHFGIYPETIRGSIFQPISQGMPPAENKF